MNIFLTILLCYLGGGVIFHYFRLLLFRFGYFRRKWRSRLSSRQGRTEPDYHWLTRKWQEDIYQPTATHITAVIFWPGFLVTYFFIWVIVFPICQVFQWIFNTEINPEEGAGWVAKLEQQVISQSAVNENKERTNLPVVKDN